MDKRGPLYGVLDDVLTAVDGASRRSVADLALEEFGVVTYIGQGVARVQGLPNVKSEELVRFEGDLLGMAFNLDPDEIGVVLLDDCTNIESGSQVRRTNRVLDVPVVDCFRCGLPLLVQVGWRGDQHAVCL